MRTEGGTCFLEGVFRYLIFLLWFFFENHITRLEKLVLEYLLGNEKIENYDEVF